MGLSKLGSEVVGQIPPPGLRDRELKRRVWWNLVFLDWYLSPFVGHTYLIHPAQCNTDLPANADWDELQDGKVFQPKNRKQWSGTAFLIAKSEVARSVRELVSSKLLHHVARNILLMEMQSDHINAGQTLTYEFLLAYEQRFNERLELGATALTQRDHILERDDRVAVRVSILRPWALRLRSSALPVGAHYVYFRAEKPGDPVAQAVHATRIRRTGVSRFDRNLYQRRPSHLARLPRSPVN